MEEIPRGFMESYFNKQEEVKHVQTFGLFLGPIQLGRRPNLKNIIGPT